MNLPNDVARCVGVGSEEDGVMQWREGCEECLRRTSHATGEMVSHMQPPRMIVLECPFLIETEDRK